jgi:hypothetical protein
VGTRTDILAGTDIPAVAATPVAGTIQVDVPIPVDVVITVEEATPVDVDTTVGVVITAVAASASGSTERLTGMGIAPATTTSRTIAILTAITISGATGIRLPPVATRRHTVRTEGIDITGA